MTLIATVVEEIDNHKTFCTFVDSKTTRVDRLGALRKKFRLFKIGTDAYYNDQYGYIVGSGKTLYFDTIVDAYTSGMSSEVLNIFNTSNSTYAVSKFIKREFEQIIDIFKSQSEEKSGNIVTSFSISIVYPNLFIHANYKFEFEIFSCKLLQFPENGLSHGSGSSAFNMLSDVFTPYDDRYRLSFKTISKLAIWSVESTEFPMYQIYFDTNDLIQCREYKNFEDEGQLIDLHDYPELYLRV